MTATPLPHEATLADHGARIRVLEDARREDREEMRSLKAWIMGTLAAALVSAFGVIISLLRAPR